MLQIVEASLDIGAGHVRVSFAAPALGLEERAHAVAPRTVRATAREEPLFQPRCQRNEQGSLDDAALKAERHEFAMPA